MEKNKIRQGEVPKMGFEPILPFGEQRSERCVSANSTTSAFSKKQKSKKTKSKFMKYAKPIHDS